jgi:hypothetical protein
MIFSTVDLEEVKCVVTVFEESGTIFAMPRILCAINSPLSHGSPVTLNMIGGALAPRSRATYL